MFATLFAIGAGFAYYGIRQHLTSRFDATPTWSRTRLGPSKARLVVFSVARPCGFQHLRAGAAFCLAYSCCSILLSYGVVWFKGSFLPIRHHGCLLLPHQIGKRVTQRNTAAIGANLAPFRGDALGVVAVGTYAGVVKIMTVARIRRRKLRELLK
jgi:hypothetical protein